MEVHGYSTLLREIPGPELQARRLTTPEGLRNDDLSAHLTEVRGWAERKGGQSPALAAVLDHLHHVQWQYQPVNKPRDINSLLAWAKQANAILRIDEHTLVDPDGRMLIGPGECNGQVPVRPEAAQRADRVRRELTVRELIVPPGALPVRSTEEVRLRRADLVGRRAVALVITADYAISVLEGRPLDWQLMAKVFPLSLADRTPTERELFTTQSPELAAQLKWGYEAAAQLLAMCGRVELTFPTEFADQGQVWNASVGVEEKALLPDLTLYGVGEVCEEWERARALHHSVRMALAGKQAPPVGLDREIVRQRYRALEWLTGDRSWEDLEENL